MSSLQIDLPESVLTRAKKIAAEQKLSLEQVIVDAVERLISAHEQAAWFEERARRGQNVDIKAILAKVPDVPPMPGDEIES